MVNNSIRKEEKMKFEPCPGCKTPAKCAKEGCQKAKNKMSYGGMAKKKMAYGGMAKKGYRNGGFCTGPAKGYKK
jgi:hypothetical protein